MFIFYYIFILYLSLIAKYLNIETYIIQLAQRAQSTCLAQAPPITHAEIWKSMICGNPLSSPSWNQLLTQVGLIHIIVVSGAHLILIKKFLNLFRLNRPIVCICEIIYCFFTGLQAPVVRAFLSQIDYLNLKSSLKIIFVIQLALCVFPSWIKSASFQMSICASLALNMIALNKEKISILFYPVIVQIYLIPFLKNFSLVAIFSNTFIAPIYEILFLVLGFLNFLIPVAKIFNSLADSLFVICQTINLMPTNSNHNLEVNQNWFWIFLCITLNWRYQIYLLRKKALKY